MERRGFLTGAGAAAVGWLTDGAGSAPAEALGAGYTNPVPLLADFDASGFDAATRARLFRADAQRTAALQGTTYPQSVASGDPSPHGIVLWTRVVPEQNTAYYTFAWQVANSPSFHPSTILVEWLAPVLASTDNTIKLPIHSGALQPRKVYFYRFLFDGVVSRSGRFKTLPSADADLQYLKLAYVSCQDWSNGYYTALAHLAEEEVDLVVHLGDYIYEYRDDGVGGPNKGPVRVVPPYPSGQQYPAALDDYRHLYKTYRGDLNQQAVHERFAYIQLWDDHEFFNDCHQDFHEDTNTPPNTATTPQPALRKAANQAWSEYGLAEVTFKPDGDWKSSIRVYRRFVFGRLAELVATDQRLYRDGPPCGDLQNQRYQTAGCANRTNPARTMLGPTQKAWFLDRMINSKATWKLWANEVMLVQYILLGVFFDLDQWDGYPVERAEILGKIRDAGVKNFVALTGDAHLFLAGYLKTNYADLTEKPMGVELLVGAISSGNYADAGVDVPAPLSAPAGARQLVSQGLPMDSLEPVVLAQNPHIKFWNGSTHGYAILEVTPAQLSTTFKVVSTVKQPTATLARLATFVVPAGEVSLTGY